MGRAADDAGCNAERARAQNRFVGRHDHRDRPRSTIRVDAKERRRHVVEAGLAVRVHLPAFDERQIRWQAFNAVRIDAAQIGPHEHVGHLRGVLRLHAARHEKPRGERRQLRRIYCGKAGTCLFHHEICSLNDTARRLDC